jgi:secondary thiamine-phosphate synthase enzyme
LDLTVKTQGTRQVIDLTDQVQGLIPPRTTGLATLTVLHSSAAVTTANLDPGTDRDLLDALELMVPVRPWRHPHDPEHAPDHLLASVIGPSVSLPVQAGKLLVGTWQRLVLIELNGPKTRKLRLTIIKS